MTIPTWIASTAGDRVEIPKVGDAYDTEALREKLQDRKRLEPNRRDLMMYITRSLTHKERFIIEQYYQVGHTMREIGEMLALTESRVCQIHSNVMARLKALLGPGESSSYGV